MEAIKKKYSEIIALYTLEKELNDIYVEGNTDKVFFENFLRAKKSTKSVISIEIVDFSEIDKDYLEGINILSNRNKTIIFSKLLHERLPQTKIRCIIDKDFDGFVKTFANSKLYKTDFSCLESYLFTEEVIEKFLRIGIGNFPFNAKLIIDQLSTILKPLFCLRLLREIHFPSAKLVEIDGNISIGKKTGEVNFNTASYVDKFIQKNRFANQRDKILEDFMILHESLNIEIRDNMNGHDFLKIFFLYVNKIKNTPNYREENFCKALFLSVEAQMIENQKLFKNILT